MDDADSNLCHAFCFSIPVLKKALRFTGKLSVLASEEENTPVYVKDNTERVYAAKRTTEVVVEDGNKVRRPLTCVCMIQCLDHRRRRADLCVIGVQLVLFLFVYSM